jgi:hypothetical protein
VGGVVVVVVVALVEVMRAITMPMLRESRRRCLALTIPLQFKVSTLPNLLEFLSFVYFFPAFLGGPAFEYKRYADFIEQKYSHATTVTLTPATKESPAKKQTTVAQKSFAASAPASWLPVLQCFLIGEFMPYRPPELLH